jgi:nitroimidazol reductase NimA-like FMN-containing flavoprotein (pyridoxamine 5'-phosphate oxidase superfamily)
MEFRNADPEFKALENEELTEFLNQPNYLRVAMINERDGTPLVHPMWHYYEDGKFFAVSNSEGTKIRSLKRHPEIYFLLDIVDRGVRGRATAKVIDDPKYAVKVLSRNLERYTGSLDSPEAKERIEVAKKYYSVVEITPRFMATWKA